MSDLSIKDHLRLSLALTPAIPLRNSPELDRPHVTYEQAIAARAKETPLAQLGRIILKGKNRKFPKASEQFAKTAICSSSNVIRLQDVAMARVRSGVLAHRREGR